MVFCYQNCSYLLWEKNVLVILKFEAESWEFAKNLRSVDQFIQTEQWKVRTIFGNVMLFTLVPGGFTDLSNRLEELELNCNCSSLLGMRNLHAQVKKSIMNTKNCCGLLMFE